MRRVLTWAWVHRSGVHRAILLSVAAASIVAAVGAWRTEAHAGSADENDREGIAQTAALARDASTLRLQQVDLVQRYARMISLRAQRDALREAAARAPLAVAVPLRVQAEADGREAKRLQGTFGAAELVERRMTAAGLDRVLAQNVAELKTESDYDGSDEFRRAHRETSQADVDAGLATVAIVAAFLLTLAHIARRRTPLLAFFAAGLLVLVLVVAGLAVEEWWPVWAS
jgi:hypothetical protein